MQFVLKGKLAVCTHNSKGKQKSKHGKWISFLRIIYALVNLILVISGI